jgi:hypothetical protein
LNAAFEDGGDFQVWPSIFNRSCTPGNFMIKGQVLRQGDDRPEPVPLRFARES